MKCTRSAHARAHAQAQAQAHAQAQAQVQIQVQVQVQVQVHVHVHVHAVLTPAARTTWMPPSAAMPECMWPAGALRLGLGQASMSALTLTTGKVRGKVRHLVCP